MALYDLPINLKFAREKKLCNKFCKVFLKLSDKIICVFIFHFGREYGQNFISKWIITYVYKQLGNKKTLKKQGQGIPNDLFRKKQGNLFRLFLAKLPIFFFYNPLYMKLRIVHLHCKISVSHHDAIISTLSFSNKICNFCVYCKFNVCYFCEIKYFQEVFKIFLSYLYVCL